MDITTSLDWWPPETPMGNDKAAELIAAVRPHAPRAVQAAKAWIAGHASGSPEPSVSAATRTMIAAMSMDSDMRGICIGSVSVPGASGKPVIVGIAVTREGELAITVPGVPDQEWRVVG